MFRVPEFLLPEYLLSVRFLESLTEFLFELFLFVPRYSFLGLRLLSVEVVVVLPDTFCRSFVFIFSLLRVTLPRLLFLPKVLVLLTSDKMSLLLVVVVTSLPLPNLLFVLSVDVLEDAQRAIYNHEEIEPVPLSLRKKYFLRSKDPKSGVEARRGWRENIIIGAV